jgi:hypothetical protein
MKAAIEIGTFLCGGLERTGQYEIGHVVLHRVEELWWLSVTDA